MVIKSNLVGEIIVDSPKIIVVHVKIDFQA